MFVVSRQQHNVDKKYATEQWIWKIMWQLRENYVVEVALKQSQRKSHAKKKA